MSAIETPIGGGKEALVLRTSVLQKHAALGYDDGYVSIDMAFAMFVCQRDGHVRIFDADI